jgi:integrase
MPWKLTPPREGKTPFWYVRGTYCGITLDRSTGTSERAAAKRIFTTWQKNAERGEFEDKPEQPETHADLFVAAAKAYLLAGGDRKYITAICEQWPTRRLSEIDQVAIDTVAEELYPGAPASTKNRQVYTPISAILKHVGIEKKLRRPKGWKGNKSTSWLEPDQAFALFEAADKIEPEFGLFCRFLVYTGMRLGEATGIELRRLHMDRAFVYLPDSKNGEPRGCHLPAHVVEAFRAQPPRTARQIAVRGHKGFFKGTGGGRIVVDAGVPFLERAPDAKLFRYHAGGALRDMLKDAMKKAGLSFPRRQCGFHIFCHTYGSWMHRWGELDTHGLTRTGRWADADSADRYVHTMSSEEARKSDLLPTPPAAGVVTPFKKAAG